MTTSKENSIILKQKKKGGDKVHRNIGTNLQARKKNEGENY
jgi:hypothetical protein